MERAGIGPLGCFDQVLCHLYLPYILRFQFCKVAIANHWAEGSISLHPSPLPCPPLEVYFFVLHQCLVSPRFVALHSYSAHGPDELDLQKGEGIRVLGKYQDGWLKGVSLVTGRVGIFPNNYVIPIFRYVPSNPRHPGEVPSRPDHLEMVELLNNSMLLPSGGQEHKKQLLP